MEFLRMLLLNIAQGLAAMGARSEVTGRVSEGQRVRKYKELSNVFNVNFKQTKLVIIVAGQ